MTVYDLLVIFMILGALAYVTRVLFKRLKKEEPGCCGCSACNTDPSRCETPKEIQQQYNSGRS